MSPGTWIAAILGVIALCLIVAWFDDIANGTPEERHRAKRDMEAMLKGDK